MARVVVLGASLTDMNLRLPRLPAPGETLLGGSFFTAPGGKGANQAIAARRAGGDPVAFLSAFGDDDLGRALVAHDEREGLDLSHAKRVAGEASGVALIFVGEDGRNLIGVAPGPNARLGRDEIQAMPASVFAAPGVLLASVEVPFAAVVRALERANDGGMTTILNPAPADRAFLDPDILRRVDVLTPNQEEARALTGLPADTPEEAARAAADLLGRGVRSVAITLGEGGCLAVSAEGAWLVPAGRVEVVDTVGAGDAFNGALAVALAEGLPLPGAAALACAAGSLAVTRPGAQGALPGRAAIERLAAEQAIRPTRLSP